MNRSNLRFNNQHICKDDIDDVVCLATKLGNLAVICPFIFSINKLVVDCPKYQPKEKPEE